ncbi:hypothetical protein VIBNIMADA3021_840167 [Vibrio nigripulchritudo MADA3021]|nr:hypothetical protein VIBNIMADA3021_840167 [Vibrio nigripulchritudo MADA3021]
MQLPLYYLVQLVVRAFYVTDIDDQISPYDRVIISLDGYLAIFIEHFCLFLSPHYFYLL